jgi:hypothetical protein
MAAGRNSKKILLVSAYFNKFKCRGFFGGGDMYVKTLLNLLKKENFEVYLVLLNASYHLIDKSIIKSTIDHPDDLVFIAKARLSPRNYLRKIFSTGLFYETYINRQTQRDTNEFLNEILEKYQLDNILVDSFYAAVLLPCLKKIKANKSIMVINNEAEFYDDLIFKYANVKKSKINRLVKNILMRRMEKKIYRSFDRIVALGKSDLPDYIPPQNKRVMTLFLDESAQKWQYDNNKTIFYIGNVEHYPNRLAINYLLENIIPRIITIRPDYRFIILGARAGEIMPKYHYPNVHFVGAGSPESASKLFLFANLMLAPIENTFGQKFKIAEAASYGTPFLASAQTMLGYPYLSDLPYAPLESPEESVKLIVEFMDDPTKLKELSARILNLSRQFINSQTDICRQCFLS